MITLRAILHGTRSATAITSDLETTDTECLCFAKPPHLPEVYSTLWEAAARKEYLECADIVAKRQFDLGAVIECFHAKSLIYNDVAMINYIAQLSLSLGKSSLIVSLRRSAYETIITVAQYVDRAVECRVTRMRNVVLVVAVREGNFEEVKQCLSKHSDPSALNQLSVVEAVRCGHTEILRLLLHQRRNGEPVVDVAANSSELLIYAASQSSAEIFDIILQHPHTRVDLAGPPAVIAAVSEFKEDFALAIVSHRDWPVDCTNEVADVVCSLGHDSDNCKKVLAMMYGVMKHKMTLYKQKNDVLEKARKRLEEPDGKSEKAYKEVQQMLINHGLKHPERATRSAKC